MRVKYFKRLCNGSLVLFMLLGACSKEEKPSIPDKPIQEEKIVRNLKADYATKPFFKFSTGEVVKKIGADNWDICFEHAQLKINGGTMANPVRSGNAKAMIANVPYHTIKDIPSLSGLKQDEGRNDFALGYRSGGKTWYYMDDNMFYTPYSEKTMIIQTADQKGFVKLQILSFYRDMPNLKGETYETLSTRTGYYTFRYQYIEKGQRFQ